MATEITKTNTETEKPHFLVADHWFRNSNFLLRKILDKFISSLIFEWPYDKKPFS